MPKKKTEVVTNPILEAGVSDLYEKDEPNFTPEDRARILTYHRELRAQFKASEAEKKAKKEAKQNQTLEELASSGF